MKCPSLPALLSCIALTAPMGAWAAMSEEAHNNFMKECTPSAEQNLKDKQAAKAHCECGAKQVDTYFTDKEIEALNNPTAGSDPALTGKLQKLVTEHCLTHKN